jgi:hypothetical protein
MLRCIYAVLEPGVRPVKFCTYLHCKETEYVYDFLERLGYVPSDEEIKLEDGTHALYNVNNLAIPKAA